MIPAPATTARLFRARRYRVPGRNLMPVTEAATEALREVHAYLDAHPDDRPRPCPCGAASDLEVTRADRNGLPCSLVLCARCGLIRMDPQPGDATLAWFYAGPYRAFHGPHAPDPHAFDELRWKGELLLAALDRAGIALEGPVVDIGCAGGWTLAVLPEDRLRIGYDFDEAMLALGRRRGLDLRKGGVEQAARDGMRARLLLCAHVVEHVPEPVAYLRSLHPLLDDGGLLYLEVPHTRAIEPRFSGDSLRYWQRAHLWDFQRGHLETFARRAGWQPVAAFDDGLVVQLCCRPAPAEPDAPLPALGAEVQAGLLHCEARRRSLLRRARRCVAAGLRRLKV